jgi:uncharacterized protein (DUF488 family)
VASQNPQIYTIGHSTQPIEDFLARLRNESIKTVVDVRSQPYSRFNPQYKRDSLKFSQADARIGYVFAGDSLGGRPNDPTCYKGGALPDAKANYLKLVDYRAVMQRDWYQAGIETLLQTAGKGLTALLCSEEDPMQCHRHHLVTQTLLERGVEVWHIRANGDVQEAQPLPDKNMPQQLSLF